MMSILGAVTLAYLAGTGTITNSAVVARGLLRAIGHAADGRVRDAGVETLAALAAPAVMSYASTCSLVMDVIESACDLAAPAMEDERAIPMPARRAV